MPQMTPAQARVIDPVLTNVARGYVNADFIAPALFPRVNVDQRGGKVIVFGKEHFRLYNTARAPGARVARIMTSYAPSNYALEDHSIEEGVPIELMQEAQAAPGLALGSAAATRAQNIIGLRLEKVSADLALNAANYAASNKITLSGTSQWSDYSGTSDPLKVVEDAKEAVRALIAKRPNMLAISGKVFAALKNHPKITDRIKYTSRDVATPDLLASLFGVSRVIVGDAIYLDDTGTVNDIWGKHAVLAYTDLSGLNDVQVPTYGYTYQLAGYPNVEMAYYDPTTRSWVYGINDSVQAVMVGADAGYLITNAVA